MPACTNIGMVRLAKLQEQLVGARHPWLRSSDLLNLAQLLLLLHLELELRALLHLLMDELGCYSKLRWHRRRAFRHHLSLLFASAKTTWFLSFLPKGTAGVRSFSQYATEFSI